MTETLFVFDKRNYMDCQKSFRGSRNQEYYLGEYTIEAGSTIDVRAEARFVDCDDTITSAGVSAGIDMALHLVSRLAGVGRAREVRRGIQYDPEPPV